VEAGPRGDPLHELRVTGAELASGLRSLAERIGRSRARGRPARRLRVEPEVVAQAPLPELATVPAGPALHRILRRQRDPELLRRCHAFELRHDRRSSVLEWIERQLRELGSPLGGPQEEPCPGYRLLDEIDVLCLLDGAERELAARIYAWEWYHGRRRRILRLADERCGGRGRELALATAPRAPAPSEPFPGYGALRTTPAFRLQLRRALGERSLEELAAAVAYEQATRRRVSMLDALGAELRRRRAAAPPSRVAP
jgi:hypothetical protein